MSVIISKEPAVWAGLLIALAAVIIQVAVEGFGLGAQFGETLLTSIETVVMGGLPIIGAFWVRARVTPV